MYIYLTEQKKQGGELVTTANLKYRGVADSDPESFAKMMAKKGLKVHVSKEYLGKLIDEQLKTLEQ